jgi:hypothetical protein
VLPDYFWRRYCPWTYNTSWNVKLLRYQLYISTNQVSSVVLSTDRKSWKSENENCESAKKPKYCAMKLNQICRRIELCMREIILRFEMNLWNFYFFLDSFIHIRILKQVPKYLANRL